MRFTVGRRLALLSLTAVGAVAATGAVSFNEAAAFSAESRRMQVTSGAMSRQWNADMLHDGIRADVMAAMYAASDAQRTTYQVADVSAKAKDLLTHFDAAAAGAPQDVRTRFTAVRPRLAQYATDAQALVTLAGRDKAAADARLPAFLALFGDLEAAMGTIDVQLLKAVDDEQAANDAELSTMKLMIVLFAVLSLGIFAAVAVWLSRSMLGQLRRLSQALHRVAGRDLSVRVPVHSDDEFGRMGAALNEALVEIGQTIQAAHNASSSLSSECSGLTAVSSHLGETAGQTAGQAERAACAAREVSEHVAAMSTATSQMDAAIAEIAGQTANAASVAAEAVRSAADSSATVAQLNQASEEIGEIVKAITSIAEQTNLLALNATIEAARAGEAGKGFAVVATEVKDLAQETGRATNDITAKIATIQAMTGEAARAIGSISEVISRINENQSMIAAAVEEQSATTAEISRSVGEVARGADQIAESVAGIASSTGATSASAGTTQQSAVSLTAVAQQVDSQISRFRI
jgi:methyl-accepting chemotaxis protein